MAEITINEISQNYTYNIGNNSYATVAMPITASWGPAFEYVDENGTTDYTSVDDQLEVTKWRHFSATPEGLEDFVRTYRGPSSNYKLVKDYSYQMAMTLLTAGYDVLVCRVCPGQKASRAIEGTMNIATSANHSSNYIKAFTLTVTAKYPGTFGNNLKFRLYKPVNRNYWAFTLYSVDSSGTQIALEHLIFTFKEDEATDSIPYIDEVTSNFVDFTFTQTGALDTGTGPYISVYESSSSTNHLQDTTWYLYSEVADGDTTTASVAGTDTHDYSADFTEAAKYITQAIALAKTRYSDTTNHLGVLYGDKKFESTQYYTALNALSTASDLSISKAGTILYREWLYNAAYDVYGLLKDKLNYSPQRVISPGWDDQDLNFLTGTSNTVRMTTVSPLHLRLMEVAYYSRCATALIDIPKSCPKKYVYEGTDSTEIYDGYAQLLSRITESTALQNSDVNTLLFSSHSALCAPWGKYKYVGTGKFNTASPSFLMLMIQRAQILNQAVQYEWALPENRKHSLNIGELDYYVSKKYLDIWQTQEGVGVNVITDLPDLGTNLWGNSTLFELPPATYQALANLSTRYLVNAVEDIAYRCGTAITFRYNNDDAYAAFYAGVTPLLETMKNVGAIEDYYVHMAADINGLDRVNANSVVGKIYLVIYGVINDISIDLIALPPGTDLAQFQ